ncbi:MAG: hypothetical protein HGGPFJEG_00822 [Ignavibacteria bacterium]|nr:hypothetical protein [Ignavibacteria bacterium]
MKKLLFMAITHFVVAVFVFMVSLSGGNKNEIFKPSIVSAGSNNVVWTDIAEGSFIARGQREIFPERYRTVKADINELKKILFNAPKENLNSNLNPEYIIELPMPDGGFSKFSVNEYSMMEPGLQSKYPEFKTFTVKGIDDPYASGKLDITIKGFHAMILTPKGSFFIDPYSSSEKEIYISYFKRDYKNQQPFECMTDAVSEKIKNFSDYNSGSLVCGPQLRTYRLACGATGEYTIFHGGTVPTGQAAVVTCFNRVNQVYEKDFAIRLTLVANNDLVIYTNPSTDPYTNENGGAMLSQNQATLDNVIGSANYDIGHVVSTGGGGIAGLAVVCNNGQKAWGVTGLPSPIGDPFYIDYVAHEVGHQYGANHTFNCEVSGCGGGNRNGGTAFEPGSASTIMGYAGICGSCNLQSFSDPFFHSGSFNEIIINTQFASGSTCPVVTNTGNTPPTVTVPSGGFAIPIRTPFSLTGSATDIENPSSLTYCWEEYDLGPPGTPNNPSGDAPIFRSFKPDTTPTRIFPKISNIVNNNQSLGEILPTYSRNLSFRLTVRDNNPGAGGVNFEYIAFTVTNTAGPFKVTSPDSAITWNSNIPNTVTWDISNTNTAPVNCQNVNIKLSTDGGYTYPTTLVSNTPNDGNQTVTVPAINSTTARIKVEAADNIFFDISNVNFTLSNTINVQNLNTGVPSDYSLSQNYPNPFNPSTNINFSLPLNSDVKLRVYDVLGNIVAILLEGKQEAGNYSYEFNASGLASGIYFYELTASSSTKSFSETRKMLVVK